MSSGDDTGERNPFAPPPADAPDQPWQPRGPRPGEGDGTGGPDGQGDGRYPQFPPPHTWGPAHPGDQRQQRPPAPQPPRLDPTDPAHRRARNAAMSGLFSLVSLFAGFYWVALLAGALGIVLGIGAMRTRRPAKAAAVGTGFPGVPGAHGFPGAHGVPGPPASNPLTPAALAGMLTGAMAVVVATSVIGLGLYYHDYVTCVRDSLTTVGADNCDRLAPKWYVDLTGNGPE
ncbi:hypothetical protein [Kitasatospora sp. NPDC097643]|uniref:hypothetical protein n=1 Tax=Kitasatospora sp. NPDC097643 TaxID=3157230 RepID=UPI0033245493